MPRRHDALFGRIASFAALRAAARKAVAGKRRKPGAAAFMANLERELIRLEGELRDGSYRPAGTSHAILPGHRVALAPTTEI